MSSWMNVTVKFEMSNGSVLECQYSYSHDYGTYWEPPSTEVGDPTYYIDDAEVEYKDLPKGLDVIADAMYDCDSNTTKFNYSESAPDDERDFEPEDY